MFSLVIRLNLGFPGGTGGKEPACQGKSWSHGLDSLGQEDPLEEGMATHSTILVWRIPWTEEPRGLQSMESQRVRQQTHIQTHFDVQAGLAYSLPTAQPLWT